MNFFQQFIDKLSNPDKVKFDEILTILRETKVQINNQIAQIRVMQTGQNNSTQSVENIDSEHLQNDSSGEISQEQDSIETKQKEDSLADLLTSLENKKKEITERIEFLEKNRLRLQAEKNIDEIRAFIDPNDASNLQYSEILNTHTEMMNKLQMQSDFNEAKIDMVLEEKKDSAQNIDLEKEAKKRADDLVQELKKNM